MMIAKNNLKTTVNAGIKFGINVGMMVGTTLVANEILNGIEIWQNKQNEKRDEEFNKDPVTKKIKNYYEHLKNVDSRITKLMEVY